MTAEREIPALPESSSYRGFWVAGLVLIVLFGAWLRFSNLGSRSLWYDEFSTWQVSRLPPADSLRWLPEVKMAPLYQIGLRGLSDDPRPAEWLLRLPAAAAGTLALLAAFWLGKLGGGWQVGCALALLLACNGLQIEYSQEARPYTLLVLGTTLSSVLWYRLVRQRRAVDLCTANGRCFRAPRRFFGALRRPRGADATLGCGRTLLCAYVVVAVLTLHAHYLAGLTLAAHAGWWAWRWVAGPAERRSLRPLAALALVGALCVPIVWRYFQHRSPVYEGLEWIPPLTWSGALEVLESLAFGRVWLLVALVPALLLWLFGRRFMRADEGPRGEDVCGLLALWALLGYGGLVVVSGLVQPLLVARYALPAAVPLLLFPLFVAQRFDRRLPLVIAVFFLIVASPSWAVRGAPKPGFRELAAYLNEHVDPELDAVALGIYDTSHPDVIACERLVFEYYPLERVVAHELWLGPDPEGTHRAILNDPRRLYLVVFQGDPEALLEAAGRTREPFNVGGRVYTQLYFDPYRLMRIAPLGSP